ncbi:unnamed protein product [Caenorhabditis bovis]|uniref:CSD domain-containing protein n=1 Tax=Caenorhabditis bovis TaxID=2654633 RepID=A0A8S1F8P0_9PELO|nr:unnamed protein product [Caenorhabditis bovis]
MSDEKTEDVVVEEPEQPPIESSKSDEEKAKTSAAETGVSDKKTDDESKSESEKPADEAPKQKRYHGTCKWFNVAKGFGFIIDDIQQKDIFVHQSNLNMGGFRSLDEFERVSYYLKERENGKGLEAYEVAASDENEELRGSRIHPIGRKKARQMRCFRCGLFTTHRAKDCPYVKDESKVCYICGLPDHISSTCPDRKNRVKRYAWQAKDCGSPLRISSTAPSISPPTEEN